MRKIPVKSRPGHYFKWLANESYLNNLLSWLLVSNLQPSIIAPSFLRPSDITNSLYVYFSNGVRPIRPFRRELPAIQSYHLIYNSGASIVFL
jgi:hypothetical protein